MRPGSSGAYSRTPGSRGSSTFGTAGTGASAAVSAAAAASGAASSSSPTVGRLGGQRHAAAVALVGGHEAEQEDHGLAGEQQQDQGHEQQHDADDRAPVPGHGERREHEQEDQQDQLEPEAAEAGAALGVERLALVVDRANRGCGFGGGHRRRVPPVPSSRGRPLSCWPPDSPSGGRDLRFGRRRGSPRAWPGLGLPGGSRPPTGDARYSVRAGCAALSVTGSGRVPHARADRGGQVGHRPFHVVGGGGVDALAHDEDPRGGRPHGGPTALAVRPAARVRPARRRRGRRTSPASGVSISPPNVS